MTLDEKITWKQATVNALLADGYMDGHEYLWKYHRAGYKRFVESLPDSQHDGTLENLPKKIKCVYYKRIDDNFVSAVVIVIPTGDNGIAIVQQPIIQLLSV